MNTTKKGRAFEGRIYEILQRELSQGRLGLLPSLCSVHLRKGYYSRDRDSLIEIDVSIEVRLVGAEAWSILWAWECKDYADAVPVNDVEEFWAKLQQIGGANIKGGIAVNGPLQSGALNFARAKGITVVRLVPEEAVERIQVICHRALPSPAISASPRKVANGDARHQRAEDRLKRCADAMVRPTCEGGFQSLYYFMSQNGHIEQGDRRCFVRELEHLVESGFPCPFCGKPLRTGRAKQCRHCRMDWHDPNNVRVLGAS